MVSRAHAKIAKREGELARAARGPDAEPAAKLKPAANKKLIDVMKFQKALALAATASNPHEAKAAELAARRVMESCNIDPTRVPDRSFVSRINLAHHWVIEQAP